ncbi:MAG: hypothetical protein ACE5JP_02440 [Candidatus Bipolaricaulia bacterium]
MIVEPQYEATAEADRKWRNGELVLVAVDPVSNEIRFFKRQVENQLLTFERNGNSFTEGGSGPVEQTQHHRRRSSALQVRR